MTICMVPGLQSSSGRGFPDLPVAVQVPSLNNGKDLRQRRDVASGEHRHQVSEIKGSLRPDVAGKVGQCACVDETPHALAARFMDVGVQGIHVNDVKRLQMRRVVKRSIPRRLRTTSRTTDGCRPRQATLSGACKA
jgi:hypothetical protein